MPVDRAHTAEPSSSGPEPGTAELLDRLSRFDGSPAEFLGGLLMLQCRVGSASGGAVLRGAPDGRAEVLAVYPPLPEGATAPVWLATAVEAASQVAAENACVTGAVHAPDDLYGQPDRRHLILLPLSGQRGVQGVGAYLVEAADEGMLLAARERLALTSSLLNLYEMRLALARRGADLARLRQALETLAAVNEQARFHGAAMALCNEVASRWGCDRVGLGFLRGRYVRLRAMSHTEKFSRKMRLVQDIEAAMEECLDQDAEVIHPAGPESTTVSRAAGDLSARHGPTAIVSLPVRHNGEVPAVLTLERPADQPFTVEEVETLRLAVDLCAARLVALERGDRWLGARAAGAVRSGLSAVIGPKHTWMKLAAVACLGAAIFLVFAKGEYRVEAPFVLKATENRVISAPFEGYLEEATVEPGDPVEAGKTVLARLDTEPFYDELEDAQIARAAHLKEQAIAMSKGRTDEAQMAEIQARQAEVRMRRAQRHIDQATVISPIDGLVTKGDLKHLSQPKVDAGQVLFEVSPIEDMYAELAVPEDLVPEVKVGGTGVLATAAHPERPITFEVTRVSPVAEVVKGNNVFKVRVRLESLDRSRMRPGMEGIGKVNAGRRRYAWIWTRRLVNWVRMKLWL